MFFVADYPMIILGNLTKTKLRKFGEVIGIFEVPYTIDFKVSFLSWQDYFVILWGKP